jgi:hypothetical protein
LCGHSRTSQHFIEPVGLLHHSKELSTSPFPESDKSSPYHSNESIQDPSYYHLPTYVLIFLVVFFPLAFPSITYMRSSSPFRATYPAHHIPLDLIILIILGEKYKLRRSSSCRFLYPPVTSSLFGPNILHSTQLSNTVSLCSSLNVKDQVSHPYRTKGKTIF